MKSMGDYSVFLMFPLLCPWPVIDNYLAEVSWPHLPILSLRHQRNGNDPHRALFTRQRSVGGGGVWGRCRGWHPRGHWTDGKGNGCPEEGTWIHYIYKCISYGVGNVGLSTKLVQTWIAQQLSDGLPWNLAEIGGLFFTSRSKWKLISWGFKEISQQLSELSDVMSWHLW